MQGKTQGTGRQTRGSRRALKGLLFPVALLGDALRSTNFVRYWLKSSASIFIIHLPHKPPTAWVRTLRRGQVTGVFQGHQQPRCRALFPSQRVRTRGRLLLPTALSEVEMQSLPMVTIARKLPASGHPDIPNLQRTIMPHTYWAHSIRSPEPQRLQNLVKERSLFTKLSLSFGSAGPIAGVCKSSWVPQATCPMSTCLSLS